MQHLLSQLTHDFVGEDQWGNELYLLGIMFVHDHVPLKVVMSSMSWSGWCRIIDNMYTKLWEHGGCGRVFNKGLPKVFTRTAKVLDYLPQILCALELF